MEVESLVSRQVTMEFDLIDFDKWSSKSSHNSHVLHANRFKHVQVL